MKVDLFKYIILRWVLGFALLDLLSIVYLIVFYTAGIDVIFISKWILFGQVLIISLGVLLKILSSGYLNRNISLVALALAVFIVGRGFLPGQFEFDAFVTFLYPFLMIGFVFYFVSFFKEHEAEKVLECFTTYARRFVFLSIPLIAIYFALYQVGFIDYFGMGVNFHYAVPFYLARGGSIFLLILLVLMTGKRAVLVNFIAQVSVYLAPLVRKKPVTCILALPVVFALLYVLVTSTTLFDRIVLTLSVDFSDPASVLVAFGGRFEEAVAVYEKLSSDGGFGLLFGLSPGDYYLHSVPDADGGAYQWAKTYAHFGPVAFALMFGAPLTAALYFYLIFKLFSRFSANNPFFVAAFGVFCSSFFGANIFVDPTSVLLLAYFLKFERYVNSVQK